MAEKKKQHFVPKTYLKRFASDGRTFSIMNVKDNTVIENVPLSKQCQKKLLLWNKFGVGSTFRKIRKNLADVFVKVNKNDYLIEDDIKLLKQFAVRAVGYSCMGVIIVFPVSHNKLVVIYDDLVYSKITDGQYVQSDCEEDVEHLNIMQYLSSEHIIYRMSKNDFDFVNMQITEERKSNRNKKPLDTYGSDEHKLLITSTRTVIHACELSFARMPHNVRKIPRERREAPSRFWDEGWCKKLHSKEYIIPEIMKNLPLNDKPFEMPTKEKRRGYRLMAKFADVYWQKKSRSV